MNSSLDTKIKRKIKELSPKGNLGHSAIVFLLLAQTHSKDTADHEKRVALLAALVAHCMKQDENAAFFGALFHDIGKLLLPGSLFDGHQISSEEYALIKTHAEMGFKALKELHLFIALLAGCHHNMCERGYGIDMEKFPKKFGLHTKKKILVIATIISICDFIDAFSTRATKIKDGSDKNVATLEGMLKEKFPDDYLAIDFALKAAKELKLYPERKNTVRKTCAENKTQTQEEK